MLVDRADGQAKLEAELTDDEELDRLPSLVTAKSSPGSRYPNPNPNPNPGSPLHAARIKKYRKRRRVPKDSPPTVGSPKPERSAYAENAADRSHIDLETIELDALGA